MNDHTRPVIIGFAVAVGVLLLFGLPTALLPSGLYKRMIPPTLLDYAFLLMSSALIGAFVGLHLRSRRRLGRGESCGAVGGSAAAFLSVSCPVCISILVSLLSAAAVMTYIEPLRIPAGIASIAILGYLVYAKVKTCSVVPKKQHRKKPG